MIVICECRYSKCDQLITLVGEADGRGASAWVEAGGSEKSLYLSQFRYETKTALKNKNVLHNLHRLFVTQVYILAKPPLQMSTFSCMWLYYAFTKLILGEMKDYAGVLSTEQSKGQRKRRHEENITVGGR